MRLRGLTCGACRGCSPICLAASAVALVAALIASDGASVYASLPARFYSDLGTLEPMRVVAIVIGVGVLVCMGADYHQFVLASRDARAAILGCVIAGIGLCLVAFLPPALVLAAIDGKGVALPAESRQAVPHALTAVAAGWFPGAAVGLLMMLSAAALGSGAAILRAMTSALESAMPSRRGHPGLGISALVLGAAAASMGVGIIDTMVSVNVLYIASTGWVFLGLLRGRPVERPRAVRAMAGGFLASSLALLAGALGLLMLNADVTRARGWLDRIDCGVAHAAEVVGTRSSACGPWIRRLRPWRRQDRSCGCGQQPLTCLFDDVCGDLARQRWFQIPMVPIQIDAHGRLGCQVDQFAAFRQRRCLHRGRQSVADAGRDALEQRKGRGQKVSWVTTDPEAEDLVQEIVVQ